MKTMHRPGAIDFGYGNGIGICLGLEPRPPGILCAQVVVRRRRGSRGWGVRVGSPRVGGGQNEGKKCTVAV